MPTKQDKARLKKTFGWEKRQEMLINTNYVNCKFVGCMGKSLTIKCEQDLST